jgi:hypothetical protein
MQVPPNDPEFLADRCRPVGVSLAADWLLPVKLPQEPKATRAL